MIGYTYYEQQRARTSRSQDIEYKYHAEATSREGLVN